MHCKNIANMRQQLASPSKRFVAISKSRNRIFLFSLTQNLQIRALMDKVTNVRNMSVIAHGKSHFYTNCLCNADAGLKSTTESPPLLTLSSNALVLSLPLKQVKLDLRTPARMNKSVVSPSSRL